MTNYLDAKRAILEPVVRAALHEKFERELPRFVLSEHNGGLVLSLSRGRRSHTRGVVSAKEVYRHDWLEVAARRVHDHVDGYADLLKEKS